MLYPACFRTFPNGSLTNNFTEEVLQFDITFLETKLCFDDWLDANKSQVNETVCDACKKKYDELNLRYFEIGELYGENLCIDVVDTVRII